MLSSKEALEKLLDLINEYSYWVEAHSYCDTIKQDLERLEVLEKENEDLKYIKIANLKHRLDEKNEIIGDLQQDYDDKDLECIDLYQKNEKLKKAIEILKDKFLLLTYENKVLGSYSIEIIDMDKTICYMPLDQQEYELLKEVMNNEI